MKKTYIKPQAEVVLVRCKDKLLDWQDEVMLISSDGNDLDHTDAKEMRIRYEEQKEMHEVLGGIFSEENLVNPWE